MGMPRRYHTYPAGWCRGKCCTSVDCGRVDPRVADDSMIYLACHYVTADRGGEPWHLPGSSGRLPRRRDGKFLNDADCYARGLRVCAA